ncbi:MAG: glycosyltransferase involved in cell wall biosynthesis, partial [Oceanospirillaceae bacterium]
FHPHEEVEIAQGNGDFCLYHGSLDVGENNQAAMYLVEKVFSKCDHKLIIAGKKPSKELQNAVALKSNIELMTNLDTEGIHDLIRDAQINVLPTFQATGLKLKLLAALYSGRHCLVNTPMIENTGLEQVCRIEGKADSMISAINELMDVEMTESDKLARKETLDQGFGNSSNAERLYEMIFGEKPEIKETSKIFGSNLL